MEEPTRCAQCGEPFATSPQNAATKRYCSQLCQGRSRGKKQRPERQCPVCLRMHRPQGLTQRTCSWECAHKLPHIGAARSFVWHRCHCGEWYVKRDARWHCQHKRTDVGRLAQPLWMVTCVVCGATTPTRIDSKRYCSVQCSKRAAHDSRAARQRQAFVEPIYRQRVYERDGWVCQLCRRPVRRDASVPHPLSATLDHIIPLAGGGTHAYANVQLAHFMCNSRKRDGDAQLRWDTAA